MISTAQELLGVFRKLQHHGCYSTSFGFLLYNKVVFFGFCMEDGRRLLVAFCVVEVPISDLMSHAGKDTVVHTVNQSD